MAPLPAVLSIHAADNLGLEGVTADAGLIAEQQCLPRTVVTSVLAADRVRVESIEPVTLTLLAQQFEMVCAAAAPRHGRVGIVRDRQQVRLIAEMIDTYGPIDLVVAPVVHVGETRVMDDDVLAAVREHLFPRAEVVALRDSDLPAFCGGAEWETSAIDGARRLRRMGAASAVVSGTNARGAATLVLDDRQGHRFHEIPGAVAGLGGAAGMVPATLAAQRASGLELRDAVVATQHQLGFRLRRGR